MTSTVQAVQGVTYPALSQLKDDTAKFSEGYRSVVRVCSFVIFPLMLGFVAIAEDMFALLLGEKWMPTVPYFEILALSGLFFPLSAIAYNVLKVQSDGRVIVRLEILRRVVMTLVLIYAIPRGVEAVAWGMTAMAAVDMLINVVAAGRYTSLRFCGFATTILPQLLAAVAMWLVLYAVHPTICGLHVALRLAVEIVAGVSIYLILSVVFRLRALGDMVELLRSKSA